MPKYVVKPGKKFGKNKEHRAGSVVELTEAEAAGHKDLLTLYEEPVAAATEPTGKGKKGKEGEGDPKE